MRLRFASLFVALALLLAPALPLEPLAPRWHHGWMVNGVPSWFRAIGPTLHAQNGHWLQGPFTVTNMTVMTPYLCANAGTCPGTPSWKTNPNVNGAQLVIESAPIRYRYDNQGVAVSTTAGMFANSGSTVVLQLINNVKNLQMIATTSSNATVWITVVGL